MEWLLWSCELVRWFEELDEWRSMQELKSEDPEKTVPDRSSVSERQVL